MPYPDNIPGAAITAATRDHPEVAERAPTACELELKARVRAVADAVNALRRAPIVFERDSHGDDALQSILVDTPAYCAALIAEIDRLPSEEAEAEEVRIAEEERWG